MISVSDEIKLRAEIAVELIKSYLNKGEDIGDSTEMSVTHSDFIVDNAIKKSLGIE